MLTSVKSSLMSGVFFEQSQGLVGIPGFQHPVTCIQEHAGCAHPFKHIVIDDDHDEGAWG